MRRMGSPVFLLAVFGLAAATCSPAQIPSPNSSATDTFKLEGTVINSVTGEPVPYALVTASSENKQALLTGPEGSFQFTGLRAGNITVMASKPGFFEDKHQPGGKSPTGAWISVGLSGRSYVSGGTGMNVAVGPNTAPITLKLVPESIIIGHVEDAQGEPIEGAMIKVETVSIMDGRKQWNQMQGASSRDDGSFRLANLPAGRYYISVQAGNRVRTLEELTQNHPMGYPAAVYYPAAPDRESAAPLDLTVGQKVEIQFTLKPQPVFKISGEIGGRSSDQPFGVRLLTSSGADAGLPVRFESATGKFEIERVPAGTYRLQTSGPDQGELTLHVTGNLNGVRLFMQPRTVIPVIVRNEATGNSSLPEMKAAPDPHGLPLSFIVRKSGQDSATYVTGLEQRADGPPVVHVPPGRYAAEIYASIFNEYVHSARYGETDLLRDELVVQPGAAARPIEVVLRDDSSTLNLKISPSAPGAFVAVVLLPEAAPRQIRMMPAPASSEVSIPYLPPGDYKVFAFDSVEQIEYRNPDVLNQYSSKAARVTLTPSGKATASLDLIHTGE